MKDFIPCQSVIEFEESWCPSILSSEARIEEEHKVTSIEVDVVPNVGTDLLLDIIDRKLLEYVSASEGKDGDSLEAVK